MQPISQKTYDMNNKLFVCYSIHYLKNKSFDEWTIGQFKHWTVLDHSNTELVHYSDPHSISFFAYAQVFSLLQNDLQKMTLPVFSY